jgi:phosphoglycolate phosphatase
VIRRTLHPALAGIELVVFDKDGTLIDFSAMWAPWAVDLANALEAVTGRSLRAPLFQVLGFDPATGRTLPHGALAVTPMTELRRRIAEVLANDGGLTASAADRALDAVWHGPDPVESSVPLADLRLLLRTLRAFGIRVAIATSDDREPTLATLRSLGVANLIDAVVSADDEHEVKPAAAAVVHLCRALDVLPTATAVVGDSAADLTMGRAAKAGRVIGVLSGVGTAPELEPLADVILPSVAELVVPPGSVGRVGCRR